MRNVKKLALKLCRFNLFGDYAQYKYKVMEFIGLSPRGNYQKDFILGVLFCDSLKI